MGTKTENHDSISSDLLKDNRSVVLGWQAVTFSQAGGWHMEYTHVSASGLGIYGAADTGGLHRRQFMCRPPA
ncbi:hypothetical protein [Rosistilla carotiformis]|uniref:hypothetical protein n=1 Tax=Rosistilla carotiformis TaxID=2528017 RepID=UPI0011AA5B48|nr:hypothetical protein [Rosistilla carotiformis]